MGARSARSLAAEATFRAALADLGAELLGPYQNNRTPVLVRDTAGHLVAPRPKNILDGQGPCRRCRPGGRALGDSISLDARARFLAHLEQLGATLLEPTWFGVNTPHRVRDAAGHLVAPRPNHVLNGRGICRICGRAENAAHQEIWHKAETRFLGRLAAAGAELLEPYRNARTPVLVRCAAGHASATWPTYVISGGGICAACAGQWDVFYVVADAGRHRIKLGVTTGDPRPRLAYHRTAGYRDVVRLMTGLPGTAAAEIESAVLAALRLAAIAPVRGREHYDVAALALVLDIADNYPVSPMTGGNTTR